MSFPRDTYPYTNFHELNLGYFIVHFREIFSQWADLYDQMTDWKDATDEELATWKAGVEADLDQRVAALRAELETWKAQTGQDIAGWEDATLAALTAWQTATQAVFEAIRVEAAGSASAAATSAGDAATAKTAAETAQAAAEAAAASVQASAAQITTNTEDIAELKTQLNDIREVTIGKNLYNPAKAESGILNYTGGVSANSEYLTSGLIPVDASTSYFYSERSSPTQMVASNTRYLSIQFDEDGEVIANTFQNINGTTGLEITTTSETAYIRVSVHAFENYVYQVEKGTALTAYEPYTEKTLLTAKLGDTPSEQVEHIAEQVIADSGIIITVTGKNILPTTGWVTGLLGSDGLIYTGGSSDNYETSDFVEVDADTDYTMGTYNATTHAGSITRKIVLVYDATKAPIANAYYNGEVSNQAFNTGENGKYVRCCSQKVVLKQLEKGTTRTPYSAYHKEDVMNYPLGDIPLTQTDNLRNKKWVVCGDSFTAGALTTYLDSGKYEGEKIVYPYIIGNRTGIDVIRFFESGQTLAFPATPGEFTNSLTNPTGLHYYQTIPEDADYITIYLGINDEHHSPGSGGGDGEDNTGEIPLGTIDDATTATYFGAWNVVLSWLIVNRPNAHIGIIVTNGIAGNDNYRLAQIAIAQKYGIPYIDLNGDNRTPAMIRTSNPNIPATIKTALIEKWRVSSTNLHPNDAAHEFESTFIENFLRSI